MKFKPMMAFVYGWLVLNVVGFGIWSIATIEKSYCLAIYLGCVALLQFVCLVGCIWSHLKHLGPRKKK
jgi:hypothetical protein